YYNRVECLHFFTPSLNFYYSIRLDKLQEKYYNCIYREVYNMKNKYYDGTKLLSMLDINGNKPEIYMCTTNRTGGKTTYFGRLLINRYLDKGEKFCLIYRYNYELDDVAEKFFKDLNTLFFPEYEMISRRRANG